MWSDCGSDSAAVRGGLRAARCKQAVGPRRRGRARLLLPAHPLCLSRGVYSERDGGSASEWKCQRGPAAFCRLSSASVYCTHGNSRENQWNQCSPSRRLARADVQSLPYCRIAATCLAQCNGGSRVDTHASSRTRTRTSARVM